MGFICKEECIEEIIEFDEIFSGCLTLISILISIYFAKMHLKYYTNPYFQDKIIG